MLECRRVDTLTKWNVDTSTRGSVDVIVIAVESQKGGAGKTTLACHLATAATAYGLATLILDTDQQATASQWAQWRAGEDPEVIDCASPTLLAGKLEQARNLGADLVVIDTPPHADIMARTAAKLADLVLVPCRPQAFDLAAVQTTAELVNSTGKPAWLVFVGGPQRAPKTYDEARELVEGGEGVAGMGLAVAPVMLTQRAVYGHSTAEGRTAQEMEPEGKAAEEVAALWEWTRLQVGIPTRRQANTSTRRHKKEKVA
jgi:chromosome partitioning protein